MEPCIVWEFPSPPIGDLDCRDVINEKPCIVGDYNMVGVAVAMVISTMHEKPCIDLHNAGKFEKSSKLSYLYDAIIQKVISYKTEPEFLSLLSLKTIDK